MSVPIDAAPVVAVTPGEISPRGTLARLLHNPLAATGLGLLCLIAVVAVVAPWIAPFDPAVPDLGAVNSAPFSDHILGGDSSGRDILSRLLVGSRVTLLGAALAVSVAAAVGIPTGLVAGYVGGWFDSAASWVSNVLMSLPNMIVLLTVIAAFGQSMVATMVAFGVMVSPGFFRLVRGQVMAVRNELYVDAARVSGLSDTRIVSRHILSVVRAPIIIQASITAGLGIIIQSGLDFLGLGDPSTATWGGMLADAFANIYVAPRASYWPGLAIAITVASLVLVGNGLRDSLQSTSRAAVKPVPRPDRRAPAAGAAASTDVPAGAVLAVRGLRIGYPQADGHVETVVEDASLDIGPGEVLGLVGESGSGKTQTAFAILDLLPRGGQVLDGRILLGSLDLAAVDRRRRCAVLGRQIAYIPQEPMSNLDPAFTVGQQLMQPLRTVGGLSRAAARRRALQLLDRVGIADPARMMALYPHQISGGMAQRVLIAGAVSSDPRVLIADEPTTALDVTVQAEVLDLIRDLQKESGMSVLLITHNFGVVADICDRVAVMQAGRIVETAGVAELFAHPTHPYTRMLLGSTLDNASMREPLDAAGLDGVRA